MAGMAVATMPFKSDLSASRLVRDARLGAYKVQCRQESTEANGGYDDNQL